MDAELRSMVMAFRVAELQALLGFAGKNKSGRKNELQARCLEMVKGKSPPVVMKIRDLYRSIQVSNYSQPYSGQQSANAFGGYGGVTTASGLARSTGYGQDNNFGKSIGYQRVTGIDGQCRAIPICPDVKLKELPFYDTQAVLIKPTSLLNQAQSPKQETQHSFCLTPSQATEISASREVVVSEGSAGVPISKVQYTVQVQLRFCALDTDSTDEQDDLFPPNLVVKVNGRLVQLPQPIPSNRPGVEPKRPSKPLNITNSVKCCPHSNNTVHVQWVTDNTRNYCMTVFMVKRLTADELFQRLKNKRIQPADFTRGRIKEITSSEEDDLCAPTSISVSVACPLGKNRMTYPCRATTCKHLQCFDANLFLLMNEKKPTFICPVCNKHLKFDDLSIDGYFMDVIRNLSFDAGNEIELFPDGHWEPVVKVKAEPNDGAPPAKRMKTDGSGSLNQTIDLEDDICIVEEDVKPGIGTTLSTVASQNIPKSSEPEIIDLLDSSDDEEPPTTHNKTSEQPTIECVEEEETPVAEKKNSSDDEEEVGIRPRRRKPRVNYCIDESSSDSSTTGGGYGKSKGSRARKEKESSPACIELSDSSGTASSPEPTNQRRAFPSVSSQSSSRSSSTSSHKNNRSGSGTSTLYSSTATTTPPVANPTGTGHDKIGSNSSDRGSVQSETTNNSYRSTNFQTTPPSQQPQPFSFASEVRTTSPNVFSYNPPVPTSTPSASSLFYPTASQTQIPLPGYPPYDPRTSWQSDLNSFINPQLNHGQMDLANPFDYNYFSNPSFHLGYDPRNGGGGVGGGGGFGTWM